ncbi:MAG: hypothetical protein K1X92_04020 [Bacteroidia bacterium]|nr:hypothetical protein [Bacteroidia bacterium]
MKELYKVTISISIAFFGELHFRKYRLSENVAFLNERTFPDTEKSTEK